MGAQICTDCTADDVAQSARLRANGAELAVGHRDEPATLLVDEGGFSMGHSHACGLPPQHVAATAKHVDEDIHFHIICLTAGSWPVGLPAVDTLQLSPVFERWRVSFECFYTQSFSGRKLVWLHHLSKVELDYQTSVDGRTVELIGSIEQAALLL